jgi:hypothetical protein
MTAAKLAVKVAALEKQIVALTAEVTRLKEKVANGKKAEPEMPWWEKHWGIFDNDPDYEKAMELGRQYRESLRPKPRKQRARKASIKSAKAKKK